MYNEVRKDYLLDRQVVIATHRKRRPTDFAKKQAVVSRDSKSTCPFCPGNERKTPPAVLVYLKGKKGVVKERDTNGLRHKDWLIRCVPNLYSAFSPPEKKEHSVTGKAVGHHEVLVESPIHSEHPASARISQLKHVISGYVDRLKALSSKSYVKHISIFRNHGLEAGASLSHAHSQIIATPMIPTIPSLELEASKEFHRTQGKCVFCDILEKEEKGPRFIWENDSFVSFAPWAGVHPFEFWIVPKTHATSILHLQPRNLKEFAIALKTCLGSLKSLLNDPPYNYGFHLAPTEDAAEHYHWHLEVYPKLSTWAGFEKSTGMYINVVPPEDAAKNLKETIETA